MASLHSQGLGYRSWWSLCFGTMGPTWTSTEKVSTRTEPGGHGLLLVSPPDKCVFRASQLHLVRACHSHLLLAHPALLVEKYRKSGFSWLWAASAFKGATGVNQSLTPIEHHLRNHLQWLQVAGSVPADTLRGIILTGWQR